MLDRLARHPYALQFALVAILTVAFTLVTDAANYRSLANLLWMVGLPIAIGLIANHDWRRRTFMAMALVGVALVTTTIIGVTFSIYY